MKNSYLLVLAASFVTLTGCKTARTFQIECFSVGSDATYTVDVTVESRMGNPDIGIVKLNAIDGILFRGLTGANCISQKPMISKSKSQVMDNPLMRSMYGASRGYEKYITGVNKLGQNQIPSGSTSVSQIKYRISVNKEILRRDLVNAGLVNSLNAGF